MPDETIETRTCPFETVGEDLTWEHDETPHDAREHWTLYTMKRSDKVPVAQVVLEPDGWRVSLRGASPYEKQRFAAENVVPFLRSLKSAK
jgi:hypothetical protein